jgi:hypothetical protein
MKSKKTLLSKISSNNLRIRYIKLGEGGKWAKDCFENNIIRLGYNSGSDEIYLNGINRKWEKIREYWLAEGKTQNTASSFSNQTREFFYDNGNTLWITFEDGFLYYGFSDGKKITQELPKGKNNNPTTFRTMDTNGWNFVDIEGKSLITTQLSGMLIKTAAYRGTICSFSADAEAYIKHRICGTVSEDINRAEKAKVELLESLKPLIKSLTDKDFEILVELVFSNSGWRRTSSTGGTQKTIDFELENTVIGESAFVQVKTKTSQKEFDYYVKKKSDSHYARMFYVYHSGTIKSMDEYISVWDLNKVTEQVLLNGLTDWVISHSK